MTDITNFYQMKDEHLYEVLTSIIQSERNPMLSEVAFLLQAGLVDHLAEPGINKNQTKQRYFLTDAGMNKYNELQSVQKLV